MSISDNNMEKHLEVYDLFYGQYSFQSFQQSLLHDLLSTWWPIVRHPSPTVKKGFRFEEVLHDYGIIHTRQAQNLHSPSLILSLIGHGHRDKHESLLCGYCRVSFKIVCITWGSNKSSAGPLAELASKLRMAWRAQIASPWSSVYGVFERTWQIPPVAWCTHKERNCGSIAIFARAPQLAPNKPEELNQSLHGHHYSFSQEVLCERYGDIAYLFFVKGTQVP
jgi:hypothetical protein